MMYKCLLGLAVVIKIQTQKIESDIMLYDRLNRMQRASLAVGELWQREDAGLGHALRVQRCIRGRGCQC